MDFCTLCSEYTQKSDGSLLFDLLCFKTGVLCNTPTDRVSATTLLPRMCMCNEQQQSTISFHILTPWEWWITEPVMTLKPMQYTLLLLGSMPTIELSDGVTFGTDLELWWTGHLNVRNQHCQCVFNVHDPCHCPAISTEQMSGNSVEWCSASQMCNDLDRPGMCPSLSPIKFAHVLVDRTLWSGVTVEVGTTIHLFRLSRTFECLHCAAVFFRQTLRFCSNVTPDPSGYTLLE